MPLRWTARSLATAKSGHPSANQVTEYYYGSNQSQCAAGINVISDWEKSICAVNQCGGDVNTELGRKVFFEIAPHTLAQGSSGVIYAWMVCLSDAFPDLCQNDFEGSNRRSRPSERFLAKAFKV
jgi:hypothetical protein